MIINWLTGGCMKSPTRHHRGQSRTLLWIPLLTVLAGVVPAPAAGQSCPAPTSIAPGLSLPMSAVRFLADDALGGRLAGSDGERCAGDYLAAEFARMGLTPGGEHGTFFQALSLQSAINPHAPGGTGRNVIAILEGTDPVLRHEFVVVGAHYDHLGEGGVPGSLAPGERAIHNGADDNASGVAAMLWTAERLANGPRPARSVTFIAFTGEESGLLGSAHYVSSPTAGPGPMVAMINLDMVGRLGNGPLIVYGVDTAAEWTSLLEPATTRAGVPMVTRGEGYGPSDHTSFYLKDVPVLHFFTNTHGDYHKPSDDWQRIDTEGLAKVAMIVHDVARAAADRRPALTLRRGAGQPPRQNAGAGYGAYLGSVPDFTPVDRGVKLSGVTAGSPADAAGIHAGDVVLAIGAHDVADLQGMTDALRVHKPGQSVDVRVLRNGETLTVRVTLGSRSAR
jgi:hypothetical protein